MANMDKLNELGLNLEDEVAEFEDDMQEDTTGVARPEGYNGEIILSPLKAIRANCIECCCGSKNEVKLCPSTTCPLWPFRFGKSPYRKGRVLTDEQKQAASNRFKKMWAEKKSVEGSAQD